MAAAAAAGNQGVRSLPPGTRIYTYSLLKPRLLPPPALRQHCAPRGRHDGRHRCHTNGVGARHAGDATASEPPAQAAPTARASIRRPWHRLAGRSPPVVKPRGFWREGKRGRKERNDSLRPASPLHHKWATRRAASGVALAHRRDAGGKLRDQPTLEWLGQAASSCRVLATASSLRHADRRHNISIREHLPASFIGIVRECAHACARTNARTALPQ